MIDDRELFERAAERFVPPERSFERLETRRERKHRNKRITAGVLALVVAAAGTGALVRAFPTGSMPANPPEDPSVSPVPGTTESGQPAATPRGILHSEITFGASNPPWKPFHLISSGTMRTLLFNDDYRGVRFMADPRPIGSGCQEGPAPTDAEALAATIRSDPDIEATEAVPVRIAGIDSLQMDVAGATGAAGAAGASICANYPHGLFMDQSGELGVWPGPVDLSNRLRYRLYLLDVPEGSSRVLAILIFAPDRDFERVVEAAAPVLDTLEFRTR